LMSANADKLARNAKVHDLHREMKTSVSELVGVTNEIRRGIDPLTVGREMLAARERQAREVGGGVVGDDAAGRKRGESDETETRARERLRAVAATGASTPSGASKKTHSPTGVPLENFVPFSAVSLGRLPGGGKENGDGVFGGRVLADALEERAVAAEALALARSGALDRSVAERVEALRNEGAEVVDADPR